MPAQTTFAYHGPLHEQVHEVLRLRIVSGEWNHDQVIPGELELSRELGVSVGTVRKAMDQLTRDNMVVRQRGRGTFVKREAGSQPRHGVQFCDADDQALVPHVTLTRSAIETAGERDAKRLALTRVNGRYPDILRLDREWRAAREGPLLCTETLIVEAGRFQGLSEAIENTSETLFSIYADHYKRRVARTRFIVQAPADATATGKNKGIVLVIERIALDARDVPIEISEQLIHATGHGVQIWP